MDAIKILDLENDGLNMAADERFFYIRCKRTFCKYDFTDMCLMAQNVIFKKDGKARAGHFNKGVILHGNMLIGSGFHRIYKCAL